MRYPITKNGIFTAVQGEGALLGTPMIFIRLAGCSVHCPECDTDYRASEKLTVREILQRVEEIKTREQWIWLTGGEPADYGLWELLEELLFCGTVGLATSGKKPLGRDERLIDFLSVSPHGKPEDLKLSKGNQINLVPGLNGLRLEDWRDFDASGFEHQYVTPLWYYPAEHQERMEECLEFVKAHPGWRLGIQAHKTWVLP